MTRREHKASILHTRGQHAHEVQLRSIQHKYLQDPSPVVSLRTERYLSSLAVLRERCFTPQRSLPFASNVASAPGFQVMISAVSNVQVIGLPDLPHHQSHYARCANNVRNEWIMGRPIHTAARPAPALLHSPTSRENSNARFAPARKQGTLMRTVALATVRCPTWL